MKEPLVSVVIPFYSGLNWLEEALESVNNQTYKNKEVIVINDGSSENTEKIFSKYDTAREVKKVNEGPAAARNTGISESKGKYVAFLDSDDIWMPRKLELQVESMEKNDYVWSQHSYEYFWEDSNRTKTINTSIYQGNVLQDCYISFKIQTSCVMVRREELIKSEIYFPINKRYGQDGAFYKQLANLYELGYVEAVLSRFRIRGNNAGFRVDVQLRSRAETWETLKVNHKIRKQLPKTIILAYKLSFITNKFYQNMGVFKTKHMKKIILGVLYSPSYFIFKFYSKKLRT